MSSAEVCGAGVDIFEWHQAYRSCQRYFSEHAQHDISVQALTALMNISLPHQRSHDLLVQYIGQNVRSIGPASAALPWPRHDTLSSARNRTTLTIVSLVPYIQRLVTTGFDTQNVLRGFFGEDWRAGIGPLHKCERQNYLFAIQSVGWTTTKCQYEMSQGEPLPFSRPLHALHSTEIDDAKKAWHQWLAMRGFVMSPCRPHVYSYANDGQRAPCL